MDEPTRRSARQPLFAAAALQFRELFAELEGRPCAGERSVQRGRQLLAQVVALRLARASQRRAAHAAMLHCGAAAI